MQIAVESVHLGEIVILVPELARDERGFFLESYRADQLAALGLPTEFRQDNHSCSRAGVVRGLHLQWAPPMAKLMRVTRGRAWMVAADVRKGSPTLGRWYGTEVSAENRRQMYAPAGFARGFCALTEVEVQYKCTAVYRQETDVAIAWDDERLGIEWPVGAPQLSQRDGQAMSLERWLASPAAEQLRYAAQAGAPGGPGMASR